MQSIPPLRRERTSIQLRIALLNANCLLLLQFALVRCAGCLLFCLWLLTCRLALCFFYKCIFLVDVVILLKRGKSEYLKTESGYLKTESSISLS